MAQTLQTNKKLDRIVGQILYRPNLISFDQAKKVASQFEEKFEEWRSDRSNDISLYSPSKSELLQISYDKITYLCEKDCSLRSLESFVNKGFNELNRVAKFKQIRRVGLRRTQVYTTNLKFEELVELIYKRFYSDKKDLGQISGESVRDVVFVLDSTKNGLNNHIEIGPVTKQEALKRFDSVFGYSKAQIDSLGDANLFIDVDLSQVESLTGTKVNSLVSSSIYEVDRLISEYLKYVFQ